MEEACIIRLFSVLYSAGWTIEAAQSEPLRPARESNSEIILSTPATVGPGEIVELKVENEGLKQKLADL